MAYILSEEEASVQIYTSALTMVRQPYDFRGDLYRRCPFCDVAQNYCIARSGCEPRKLAETIQDMKLAVVITFRP